MINKVKYVYPEVKMTDCADSAMLLKTTAGFKHHKLKVLLQPPVNSRALVSTINRDFCYIN